MSRTLAAPCLLYDLPDFTTGLSSGTTLALLRSEPFIIGIKDSSGRAGNLTTLTGEPARKEWTLLVGDDRLLSAGLTAGWDGGISGVAACCPELVVALVRSSRAGEHREALRLQAQVDEVVVHLSRLPTPWGIRAALQIRGFDTGPWPLPPSAARQQQIAEFQEWILRQLPFVVKT